MPRYSVLYFLIIMPWSTKLSWVLPPACSAALPYLKSNPDELHMASSSWRLCIQAAVSLNATGPQNLVVKQVVSTVIDVGGVR